MHPETEKKSPPWHEGTSYNNSNSKSVLPTQLFWKDNTKGSSTHQWCSVSSSFILCHPQKWKGQEGCDHSLWGWLDVCRIIFPPFLGKILQYQVAFGSLWGQTLQNPPSLLKSVHAVQWTGRKEGYFFVIPLPHWRSWWKALRYMCKNNFLCSFSFVLCFLPALFQMKMWFLLGTWTPRWTWGTKILTSQ